MNKDDIKLLCLTIITGILIISLGCFVIYFLDNTEQRKKEFMPRCLAEGTTEIDCEVKFAIINKNYSSSPHYSVYMHRK